MKELIILAGGLGTRLRSEVPDLPKCLAPVNGRPFINYVINYFKSQGIEKFIFALGYKAAALKEHLLITFPNLSLAFSNEDEPLGTGGAIKKALKFTEQEQVFITNGDTLFKVKIDEIIKTHQQKDADCTIALKPMEDFNRFGVVKLNSQGKVISFEEKRHYELGLINGGLYLLNKSTFLEKSFEDKFSFEKQYLEKYYSTDNIHGSIQEGYFIDMGIPEDYYKASIELKNEL